MHLEIEAICNKNLKLKQLKKKSGLDLIKRRKCSFPQRIYINTGIKSYTC